MQPSPQRTLARPGNGATAVPQEAPGAARAPAEAAGGEGGAYGGAGAAGSAADDSDIMAQLELAERVYEAASDLTDDSELGGTDADDEEGDAAGAAGEEHQLLADAEDPMLRDDVASAPRAVSALTAGVVTALVALYAAFGLEPAAHAAAAAPRFDPRSDARVLCGAEAMPLVEAVRGHDRAQADTARRLGKRPSAGSCVMRWTWDMGEDELVMTMLPVSALVATPLAENRALAKTVCLQHFPCNYFPYAMFGALEDEARVAAAAQDRFDDGHHGDGAPLPVQEWPLAWQAPNKRCVTFRILIDLLEAATDDLMPTRESTQAETHVSTDVIVIDGESAPPARAQVDRQPGA